MGGSSIHKINTISSKKILVIIVIIVFVIILSTTTTYTNTTEKESRRPTTRQRFLSHCSLDKDRGTPASMFQIIDF